MTDAATGQPLTGATVSTSDGQTHTNAQGRYNLSEPVGTYRVTGYHADKVSAVSVTEGATTTENIVLSPLPHVTRSHRRPGKTARPASPPSGSRSPRPPGLPVSPRSTPPG